MVRKLSKALRGTSLKKKMERRVGKKRFSFERVGDGDDCTVGPSDESLRPLICNPIVEKGDRYDDSDLDSLSDILGGPYRPAGRSAQEGEANSTSARDRSANIHPSTSVNRQPSVSTQGDDESQDDDETMTEEEIKLFMEEFRDPQDQATEGTPDLSAKRTWKRQIEHLLHPKRLSLGSKDEESATTHPENGLDAEEERAGEFLEYGGNAVVIHHIVSQQNSIKSIDSQREEQEMSEGEDELEEEDDDEEDDDHEEYEELKPRKIKSHSHSRFSRWKVVAKVWKRGIYRGKTGEKKSSHSDNLSTDSSSASEVST
jgi:hypothetical protein